MDEAIRLFEEKQLKILRTLFIDGQRDFFYIANGKLAKKALQAQNVNFKAD